MAYVVMAYVVMAPTVPERHDGSAVKTSTITLDNVTYLWLGANSPSFRKNTQAIYTEHLCFSVRHNYIGHNYMGHNYTPGTSASPSAIWAITT